MKTVIDAVNGFRGDWPYAGVGDIHSGGGSNKVSWSLSCTKKEFNQCVQELSTNFGRSIEYKDYKFRYYAAFKQIDCQCAVTPYIKTGDNMIKFDLEKALAGDKVITRDGREVTQLHKFDVGVEFLPVVGVINYELKYWDMDGISQANGASFYDLFMAPKKLSGFVNVYTNGDSGYIHDTKKSADNAHSGTQNPKIACIDLSKFDEGEGL